MSKKKNLFILAIVVVFTINIISAKSIIINGDEKINSSNFACNNPQDLIFQNSSTVIFPLSTGGNIYVKSGATLTINTNVELGFDKAIIVENGGKLVLNWFAKLDKCPSATYWKGILVETGGEIFAQGAEILNAEYGIEAEKNSIVEIDDVEIIGLDPRPSFTFGIGLHFIDGVNAVKINNITIKNYFYGIFLPLGKRTYDIKNCNMDNVDKGVESFDNLILFSGNTIVNSRWPLNLVNADGSIISNNSLGNRDTGIRFLNSDFFLIENNTIGYINQKGLKGIYLLNCVGAAIKNNPKIEATDFGLDLANSDALIENNNINISGSLSENGRGIQIEGKNGSQIIGNIINCNDAVFGIETIESSSTISNNTINLTSPLTRRPAAIKLSAELESLVEENVINGNNTCLGIIAENSSFNHIWCNQITDTKEGIGIFYNSDEQEIKGNEMDAVIDLELRSAVGPQTHHGNKFIGGTASAIELDQFQWGQSIFKVNPSLPNGVPSIINPIGWFQFDGNNNYYTCDGTFGPVWTPFGGDPTKICAYWNYLKSIQTSNPELFFIKLYHLVKYSKIKPGFNLPNCIILDPVFQTLCGLTKLVDVSVALDKLGKLNASTSTLTNLQSQYVNELTESGKTVIKNLIATQIQTLSPLFDSGRILDSVRLDSIETELNTILCTQIIVTKWKEILKLYVKFLRQGEIAQNDRSAILSYSTDCADLYGDAIHLARAMANTFDNTHFDNYDGCLQDLGSRSSKVSDGSDAISIYPNPTSSKVFLKLPEQYNGQADVYNLDGRLMNSFRITDSNINEIDLSDFSGVYYVQLRSIDGQIVSKKIIVLK